MLVINNGFFIEYFFFLILETESNQEDTLLYVNQGYLQFNIFNLISKDRKISKIVLLDSELNIRYDKDGNPNFKIFKQSDQQEEKIKLNQVYLNNCFISYFHESKLTNKKKLSVVWLKITKNVFLFYIYINLIIH